MRDCARSPPEQGPRGRWLRGPAAVCTVGGCGHSDSQLGRVAAMRGAHSIPAITGPMCEDDRAQGARAQRPVVPTCISFGSPTLDCATFPFVQIGSGWVGASDVDAFRIYIWPQRRRILLLSNANFITMICICLNVIKFSLYNTCSLTPDAL